MHDNDKKFFLCSLVKIIKRFFGMKGDNFTTLDVCQQIQFYYLFKLSHLLTFIWLAKFHQVVGYD